ncbi:hypothetical protein OWV82_011199, partial [Melia azedarach]
SSFDYLDFSLRNSKTTSTLSVRLVPEKTEEKIIRKKNILKNSLKSSVLSAQVFPVLLHTILTTVGMILACFAICDVNTCFLFTKKYEVSFSASNSFILYVMCVGFDFRTDCLYDFLIACGMQKQYKTVKF